MSNLKMPSITIAFKAAAQASAARNGRGTVGCIVRQDGVDGTSFVVRSAADLPAALTAENRAFVERALLAAQSVILYVLALDEELDTALAFMATQVFSWLCVKDADEADNAAVTAWLKAQREENHAVYKAVLAKHAAGYKRVVNFTTDEITIGEETLSAENYTSRIAGILAGLPLTQSATYEALDEVQDVTRLTKTEQNTAVDNGELIAFHDGSKVRLGRGVTSLVKPAAGEEDLMKIHVLEVRDTVESDLRQLVAENYIGKCMNNYKNKLALLTAVKTYLQELEGQGVLQEGSTAELDLAAQSAWLKEHGANPEGMTDEEILEANTDTAVFLQVSLSIYDAMEDVAIAIYC